jgi:6-pyruvoyl-tetrahydropterin synthase related domain
MRKNAGPETTPLPAFGPLKEHQMRWTNNGLGGSRYWGVTLILAASIGLGFPALHNGMPDGHDSYEHVSRYSSVASQFREGEIYPRWLANMNSGLGSPALFVYAPLPYFVPGLVSPLLRLVFGKNELLELGVSVWLALSLSGISAWLWLRLVASSRAATIAAILYMLMPYHLTIDLYTRGAVAEMWAFVWMPLTLYFSMQLIRKRSRVALVGLAMSYAALVFTHLLIAFIFTPIILAVTVCLATTGHRLLAIRNAGASLVLGLGLSAVYVIPALAHERSIPSKRDYLAQTYDRHFIFAGRAWTGTSFEDRYLRKVSWLTLSTAAAAIGAFLLSLGSNRKSRHELFWVVVMLVSLTMMLPVSNSLWKIIPALPAIQFPWRFNTILALAAAALLASAVDAARGSWSAWRVLVSAGLACVAFLWMGVAAKEIVFRPPWKPAMTRPFGDTLIAVWARWTDPQFLTAEGVAALNARSTIREGLHGAIVVGQWSPRDIRFTSNTQNDNWLIARRFYYPGWIATTEAGRALAVGPSPGTGLIQVNVPGGRNEVHLMLPWGSTEKLGGGLSALCGLLASALLLSGLRSGVDKSGFTSDAESAAGVNKL